MITSISRPASSSPLSSIQGTFAYGDGNPDTVTTITYAFVKFSDSSTWTTSHKSEFRAALAAVEEIANVRFEETIDSRNADLIEAIAPSATLGGPNTLGFHETPSNNPSLGAFSTDFWSAGFRSNGEPGGFFFTALIHELGHALGLAHPHDSGLGTTVMPGVTSEFGSYGNSNLNQGVYTVMSYNDGWAQEDGFLSSSADHGGSTGYGALDIAALQAMYGANTSTNSGNTVYTLPTSNSDGTGYKAIWDTGGRDTIQYNGSRDVTIDLRPATLDYSETGGGVVSRADGIKGGFTIANGVVIENATGGSGDDLIVGNTSYNALRGKGGDDRILSASDGRNDNLILAGEGRDYIQVAGGTGSDEVRGEQGNDLAAVHFNNGSFSGGGGSDTVRFITAMSNYVFLNLGTKYEFLHLASRTAFTVLDDVEFVQFRKSGEVMNFSEVASVMAIENIDAMGTSLQYSQQGAYVLDGGGENAIITYQGTIVTDKTFGPWQAINAEADGNGYRVLWSDGKGGYSDWTVDAQGAFQSVSMVSNLIDIEGVYNADLNNDGLIGGIESALEDNGSATLWLTETGSYRIDDDVDLTYLGRDVGPTTFGVWSAVQVEAIVDGYRVLWTDGDGTYTEWTVDADGAYQSHVTVDNIWAAETFYGADINNDGVLGDVETVVESNGSTTLSYSLGQGYLIDGATQITLDGDSLAPGDLGQWSAVQVEQTAEGYQLLWSHAGGAFANWTLDSSGAHVASEIAQNIDVLEPLFEVDIDNDGSYPRTVIETNGSTTLSEASGGFYLINDAFRITYFGLEVGPNTFGDWVPIHAEAIRGEFRVLWKNDAGDYSEWTTDGAGRFRSVELVDDVIEKEDFYSNDIDGSGTVGFAEPKLARTTTFELDDVDQFDFEPSDHSADLPDDGAPVVTIAGSLAEYIEASHDHEDHDHKEQNPTAPYEMALVEDAFWL